MSGSSVYPNNFDNIQNPSTDSILSDPSHSGQHGLENDAIESIENELGVNPRGTDATVAARLARLDVSDAATGASLRSFGTGANQVARGIHAHSLDATSFSDVQFTSLANGQTLTWDSATSRWTNKNITFSTVPKVIADPLMKLTPITNGVTSVEPPVLIQSDYNPRGSFLFGISRDPLAYGLSLTLANKQQTIVDAEALFLPAGERFDIDRQYYLWEDLIVGGTGVYGAYAEWTETRGRIPWIDIKANRRSTGAAILWSTIGSGGEDTYITALAQRLKAWGKQAFLCFHNEPEISTATYGTATDYKNAWSKIKTIFTAQGVTNVTLVFSANSTAWNYATSDARWAGNFCPPATVIGAVSCNALNFTYPDGVSPNYTTQWSLLAALVDGGTNGFYQWTAANRAGLPLYLGALGCIEDPSITTRRTSWYTDAETKIANTYTRIKGVVMHDTVYDLAHTTTSSDWRLSGAAATTQSKNQFGTWVKARRAATPSVIHVSVTGSDTNTGTAASPVRTVLGAIGKVATNGQIIMHAGTWYGETVDNIPSTTAKVFTIQPYLTDQVWIKGSVQVNSTWTPTTLGAASCWKITPSWNMSTALDHSFTSTSMDPNFPMAGMPDGVWFDGVPLIQIDNSTITMGPGKFYIDLPNNVIYVGSDPAGKNVEVTKVNYFGQFNAGQDGSAIKGIGFAHYGSTYDFTSAAKPLNQAGAIIINNGQCTFENVTFTQTAGRGIQLVRSPKTSITNCLFMATGLNGIAGTQADNLTVKNTRVSQSNKYIGYYVQPGPTAQTAGIKITSSDNVTIDSVLIDENRCNGLWFDVGCGPKTVIHSTMAFNYGYGYTEEIGDGTTAVDNLFYYNGMTNTSGGVDGGRISGVRNSRWCNNTFADNRGAQFAIYEDGRTYQVKDWDFALPNWRSTTAYAVGDKIQTISSAYVPSFWVCTVANTNQDPVADALKTSGRVWRSATLTDDFSAFWIWRGSGTAPAAPTTYGWSGAGPISGGVDQPGPYVIRAVSMGESIGTMMHNNVMAATSNATANKAIMLTTPGRSFGANWINIQRAQFNSFTYRQMFAVDPYAVGFNPLGNSIVGRDSHNVFYNCTLSTVKDITVSIPNTDYNNSGWNKTLSTDLATAKATYGCQDQSKVYSGSSALAFTTVFPNAATGQFQFTGSNIPGGATNVGYSYTAAEADIAAIMGVAVGDPVKFGCQNNVWFK